MVSQTPGALLDMLVGVPGDKHAIQAWLLHYYFNRVEEVGELERVFCRNHSRHSKRC